MLFLILNKTLYLMKAIYKFVMIVCAGGALLSTESCSKKQTLAPAVAQNAPAKVYDSNNHAALYPTTGMATDASGNLYLAKGNMIVMITPAGVQTNIAGNTNNENGYADGKGSAAMFDLPGGLAIDANKNLYVADAANNAVRKITPDGTVTTIAGSGKAGYTDGQAKAASFNFPQGIVIDNNGNIYVADTGNDLIRRITPDGTVTTIAGKVESGKVNGTGITATFNIPQGITIDASDNLYVADAGNNLIRKISPGGLVSTFAGSGYATSFDGTGNIAAFDFPNTITIGTNGYLYITEAISGQVSKITTTAQVTRLNMTDVAPFGAPYVIDRGPFTPPDNASMRYPNGISFISKNNSLYVADYGNGYIKEGSIIN
jgi:sugar lactone lactonase YvrE